jgi:mono/diheme cytochrome c family protein
MAADGRRLYVQNFMPRSVSSIDLTPLMAQDSFALPPAAVALTVATERLAANVLRGKQLFHDARDPRLARDAYVSCASCHADGGHDGRTWDLTGHGEGLRNTASLRGRAGLGQGRVHWTQNFDEVQVFETQIRNLAGGTGLMSDTAHFTGTRAQPLGTAKAGQSVDLDALAAYVASLDSFAHSAARTGGGALSSAASAGRTVFVNQQCASCHGGTAFTNSAADNRFGIGTLKPASGRRLGATLDGIDIPTLRDVAGTGPYLHAGSAATLEAAISAHAGIAIGAADLGNLAQYLREIGNEETSAPARAISGAGLKADYHAGAASFTGRLLLSRTEAVDFDWGTGRPAVGVPANRVSVRWSGTVTVPTTGTYTFRTLSDDGVRLWVNGTQRINNCTDHAVTTNTSGSLTLTAGQRIPVVLEYYERGGGAQIRLQWRVPGSSSFVAVPASRLSH